jgi:hypothetical protein
MLLAYAGKAVEMFAAALNECVASDGAVETAEAARWAAVAVS